MKDIIGVIAVILTFIGYIPYISDTAKGKTKPHIYSWFIWAFVTFIVLITIINTLAVLPTVRKSWSKPQSETLFTWMLGAVRNLLGIIALENYSVLTWLYPVSSLLVNVLFSLMLVVRRRQVKTFNQL